MARNESTEHQALDAYGIVFIYGAIDQDKAETICQRIIEFNLSQDTDSIQLIINSTGGICAAGFAVIDLMGWSRLPIYTTGVGIVGSMALSIFMAGDKGHRVLTPRTSILSHSYKGVNLGTHSDLIAHRYEEDLMYQRILDHYIRHTGLKTEEEIREKLLRDVDTWLSPQEAVDLGLADAIQQDRKPALEVRL